MLGSVSLNSDGAGDIKDDRPEDLVGDHEAWWSLALLLGGFWTAQTFLPNSLPPPGSPLPPLYKHAQRSPSSAKPVSRLISCSVSFLSASQRILLLGKAFI